MLNSAWPSLHWQLFDFYMRPAGAYFGVKAAISSLHREQLAYDYVHRNVYLINRSRDKMGERTVDVDIIDQNGKSLVHRSKNVTSEPNTSREIGFRVDELDEIDELVFLRLTLIKNSNYTMSKSDYWLPGKDRDTLEWNASTPFYTPTKHYVNLTSLDYLPTAKVTVHARRLQDKDPRSLIIINLANLSPVPAVFIKMSLVHYVVGERRYKWEDILPVTWSDNYLTLWPHEERRIEVRPKSDTVAPFVQLEGLNVPLQEYIYIFSMRE